MRTNVFGSPIDPHMRTIMGRDHPLNRMRDNEEKLAEPIKIKRFEINKQMKSPVKGYKLFKATAIGEGYIGELLDKHLRRGRRDIDCFCLTRTKDKFTSFFSVQETFGQIMVVQQEVPSIARLKKNLNTLHHIVFKYLKAIVAVARAAPPIVDTGTWGQDRRQEKIEWSYDNRIKIPRLSLLWCHLMEGMIPEMLLDSSAESDGLVWLGTKESVQKIDEEKIDQINEEMPERIKWRLEYV